MGLHIAVETIADGALRHDAGCNLDDLAAGGAQAGGLGVKHHDLVSEQRLSRAFYGIALLQVVDAVGLDAVEHLDVAPVLFQAGLGLHGLRKGLHHAVIGDGQGPVPHGGRQLQRLARVTQAVHAGHIGVQVQLHPLVGGLVLAHLLFSFDDGGKIQRQLLIILGIVRQALNDDVSALFDAALQPGCFLIGQHLGGPDGACAVAELEHDHGFVPAVELFELHQKDLTLHGDLAAVQIYVRQPDHFPGKGLAVNHLVLFPGAEHGGAGVPFGAKLAALGPLSLGRGSRRSCRAGGLAFPAHLRHTGGPVLFIPVPVRGRGGDLQAHRAVQQGAGLLFQLAPQLLQPGGVPGGADLQRQFVFGQHKSGLPQAGGGRRIFLRKALPQVVAQVKGLGISGGQGLFGSFGHTFPRLDGIFQQKPYAGYAISPANGGFRFFKLSRGDGRAAFQPDRQTGAFRHNSGHRALPDRLSSGGIGKQVTESRAHSFSPVMASISPMSRGKSWSSGTL